jgi:hypothetical protein
LVETLLMVGVGVVLVIGLLAEAIVPILGIWFDW